MLVEVNQGSATKLYQYLKNKSNKAPYEFQINEQDWLSSMFYDIDGEGDVLFKDLKTYTYEEKDNILGFIQYGISAFTLEATGKNKALLLVLFAIFIMKKDKQQLGKL